jgi:hypothetical protein
MRLHPTLHRRPGFTLIEVLVAAGLCMLIMSVLTFAFAAGIDTFSLLKSTGELNQRLTVAETVLQGDLRSVHLEDTYGLPLKVSQVRYDLLHTPFQFDPALGRYVRPPAKGFFRIVQESVSFSEGNDPDGVPSSFAYNHVLHMTVRRTGDQPHRAFFTRVPNLNPNPTVPNNTASDAADAWTSDAKAGLSHTAEYASPGAVGTPGRRIGDFGYRLQHECIGGLSGGLAGASDRVFASPWAEVVYFLRPTGTTTAGGSRQLFSLHRRVRVLTKNDSNLTQLSWLPFRAAAPGMSSSGSTGGLNGPGDITDPVNRLGGLTSTRVSVAAGANVNDIGATADAAGNMTGEDILLTNVISFEVKASWDPGIVLVTTTPNQLAPVGPPAINPLAVRAPGADERTHQGNVITLPLVPPPANPLLPTATMNAPDPYLSDRHVPESPTFDDLPLVPSLPRGYSANDTATPTANTHNFSEGSGNSSFARWYTNGGFDSVNPPANPLANLKRVFDTWTSHPTFRRPGMPVATPTPPWNEPVFEQTPGSHNWFPNPNYVPLPIRLKAVQIKIRIFDPKNKLTRQITLVQDV